MKFENFNITLFRGFFGNDTYDAVKEQDFVFRVTTDAVKDLNNFKQAFTYQHEDVMGNIRTIVEFNLHAVTAAAKVCGAVTEEDIKVHRLGVLVHELVHVKQLAEKRLTGGFRCVKWDDKEFPAETKSYYEYLLQPWEREAHIAGYSVMYDMSEEHATELFERMVYNARPFRVRVMDTVKSIFRKESK